jgi:hypothetical protein
MKINNYRPATFLNIYYLKVQPYYVGVLITGIFNDSYYFYSQFNENIKDSILGNLFLLNYKIISYNNDTVEYCVPIVVRKNNNQYEMGYEYPENKFNPIGELKKISVLINKIDDNFSTFLYFKKNNIYSLNISNDLNKGYIKILQDEDIDFKNSDYFITIKNYVITDEQNGIIERIGEHKYAFLTVTNNLLDGLILGKIIAYDEFRNSFIFIF